MEYKEIKSAMEAVLFASGEPISIGRIAEVLEIDKSTARRVADAIADEYEGRGIQLVWLGDHVQLCTRGEYGEFVKKTLDIKRSVQLSPAAFEALAVIAYHQPVTKGYVEQVRGVECGSVVNLLVEKGLVEERGRLNVPGHPILYGTTLDFLRCFGLGSIEELPDPYEQDADVHQIEFSEEDGKDALISEPDEPPSLSEEMADPVLSNP